MTEALIGSQVGNFTVTALLGAGAMGTVYLGEHAVLGHRVAIKVMQASLLDASNAEHAVQRFITEAKALAQIKDSPHVIRLHDFGQLDGGALYYVMEHLEGHDLEQDLAGKLPLSPAQAAPLVEQICAGLAAAHGRGIVHRDLKPANVFVAQRSSGDTQLKLIDFGLAKNLATEQKLTVGGMGTPLYASPEQLSPGSAPIGAAADIYALGVLVYRLLSGKMPFEINPDAHPMAMLMVPLQQDPIPLSERAPSAPAAIVQLLAETLSKQPAARPASAEVFARRFREALGSAAHADDAATAATQAQPQLAVPPTRIDRSSPPAPTPATQVSSPATLSTLSTLSGAAGQLGAVGHDTEADRPARQRSRTPLLLGAVAVVAIAAAAIFMLVRRGGNPAPATAATSSTRGTTDGKPAPERLSVRVEVFVPDGTSCRAEIDGKARPLPRALTLQAGATAKLRVRCRGYQPSKLHVVRAEQRVVVVKPRKSLESPSSVARSGSAGTNSQAVTSKKAAREATTKKTTTKKTAVKKAAVKKAAVKKAAVKKTAAKKAAGIKDAGNSATTGQPDDTSDVVGP